MRWRIVTWIIMHILWPGYSAAKGAKPSMARDDAGRKLWHWFMPHAENMAMRDGQQITVIHETRES